MTTLSLIDDIIVYICNYLNEFSKMRWMSICKRHRALINRITINYMISYGDIYKLSYRDIFINVFIEASDVYISHGSVNIDILLPRVKYITFDPYFNVPVVLPQGLRAVIFGYYFNQPVTLPAGLKRATFGDLFDQHINFPGTPIRIYMRQPHPEFVPKNVTMYPPMQLFFSHVRS